jgi:hypothetical protein
MIATTLSGVSNGLPEAAATYWIEPGTDHVYPLSFRAYRRAREAEEKPLPRHRTLGPDIDHYVWRRGLNSAAPGAEVHLTVRATAPPRVRRIVSEVLRAIRRGHPAGDAIRHVSRRFGLRQAHARAFISASIGFELRPDGDTTPLGASAH